MADRLQYIWWGEQASLRPNRLFKIGLHPSLQGFASRLFSGGNSDQAMASVIHYKPLPKNVFFALKYSS